MRGGLGILLGLIMVVTGVSASPASRADAGETAVEAAPAARQPTVRAAYSPLLVQPNQPGRQMDIWGFDIKQACPYWKKARRCKAMRPINRINRSAAYARAVFGSGSVNMIRIPIRADRYGVRANGLVRTSFYAPYIRATKRAMAARLGQGLIVFASRSTVTACPQATEKRPVRCPDYAPALKRRGKVVPALYARLLVDYLRLFARHGVRIDVLGMENEPANNEGKLVRPGKFQRVVSVMRHRMRSPLPQLAMACTGSPRPGWLRRTGRGAANRGDTWSSLTYATTHYGSGKRDDRAALVHFARVASGVGVPAHRKPLHALDTEFHWHDLGAGAYRDAREAVFGTFDHIDAGFRGIVWWAYSPEKKRRLMRALVESTARAPRVPVAGWNRAPVPGGATVRAFRRGNEVRLWVVNDSPKAHMQSPLRVEGMRLAGRPTFTRWSRRPSADKLVVTHGRASSGLLTGPSLMFPAGSITLVRMQLR